MLKDYVRFFSKIFWFSILIIVFSFLVEAEIAEKVFSGKKYLLVILDISKSVGVALLVANIFSYIIGTEDFVEYINKKLRDVIISNDFISELDRTGQEKLARIILGPTRSLSDIYHGIEEYFDQYIEDSFNLFSNIFRGKLVVYVKAKYDKEKSCVVFHEEIEYRSFKVNNRMAKLRYNFEDERSEHVRTKITTPEGNSFELGDEDESENIEEKDPAMSVKKIQAIPDTFTKYDYLDIERKFVEYGGNHWGLFSYKASQPSDGLRVKFECYDGLKIRYVNTYGKTHNFDIEPPAPEGSTEVTVSCRQWLTPGFGVVILVAQDHQ